MISISFLRVHWLEERRESEGATYFVAQSKRAWPITPKWFLAGEALGGGCFPDAGPGSNAKTSGGEGMVQKQVTAQGG